MGWGRAGRARRARQSKALGASEASEASASREASEMTTGARNVEPPTLALPPGSLEAQFHNMVDGAPQEAQSHVRHTALS